MDSIENEWYGVRHSGEIPEIALYSAFYYLTEDSEGPRLSLAPEQQRQLVLAAELRFKEIVLRDLHQANRGSGSYRGVKRSIANWQRYETFCGRQDLDPLGFRHEVAAALLVFLAEEVVAVERGERHSSINCTFDELSDFACRVGLVGSRLPDYVRPLCRL